MGMALLVCCCFSRAAEAQAREESRWLRRRTAEMGIVESGTAGLHHIESRHKLVGWGTVQSHPEEEVEEAAMQSSRTVNSHHMSRNCCKLRCGAQRPGPHRQLEHTVDRHWSDGQTEGWNRAEGYMRPAAVDLQHIEQDCKECVRARPPAEVNGGTHSTLYTVCLT